MDIKKAQFKQFEESKTIPNKSNLDLLNDVNTDIDIKFAQTNIKISEITKFSPGYILPLDKSPDNVTVDIMIQNKKIATGEIVVLNDNLGIKIIEIEKSQKIHR